MKKIYTIGHSTRGIAEFIGLLKAFDVDCLADIRTVPGSRHNPQFNQQALMASLRENGIAYRHLKALGGLRKAAKESVNPGWRNKSFRNFADYMQTPEFEAGLIELIGISREKTVALMCAEALPWRCHRCLVADALLARGIAAHHIMGPGKENPHSLTPFARVDGHKVTYPAEEGTEEGA